MSDDTLAWLADKVRMFLSFYPAAQAFETYVAAVTRVLAGRPDIEQERWEAGYETRANEERLGYHCAPAAAQPPARIAELEALLTRCEPRLVSDLRIAEYAEDSATADALRLLLADIARSTDP